MAKQISPLHTLQELLLNDADSSDDDELYEMGAAAVGTLVAGVCHMHEQKNQNRKRLYLKRSDLLRNPRFGTPWQQLYGARDDRAYITTMGFDTCTFDYILEGPGHFREHWENTPIPRNDVATDGEVRLYARSLDAAGALGLVLHYLSSSMREDALQQIFALTPAVCSRYLQFSQAILLRTFRQMPEGQFHFPSTHEEYEALSAIITERHPLLKGAFGSVDGLHLPAQTSSDPEIENATYNSWTSSHSKSNIICFSPKGLIMFARMNAPGSWHDARIAQPLYDKLQFHTPDGYFIIGDVAFPTGATGVRGKIKVPPKSGRVIEGTSRQIGQQVAFMNQLVSYRQTAEWGMRMIQGSFGRLRVPLPIGSNEDCANLIELCFRGINVRTKIVGINQINTVYKKTWVDAEDEKLWEDLGGMMFGEIRRYDRVSRFYLNVD